MASIEKGCNGQSLAEIVHSSIQSVTFSNNGNNNVSLTPSHVSIVYVPPPPHSLPPAHFFSFISWDRRHLIAVYLAGNLRSQWTSALTFPSPTTPASSELSQPRADVVRTSDALLDVWQLQFGSNSLESSFVQALMCPNEAQAALKLFNSLRSQPLP